MTEEVKIADNTKYQVQGYLCYLGILVLIPLLMVKKQDRDEFLQFHIKQGVGLCLTSVAVSILRSMIGGTIGMILGILSIAFLVLLIIGLINVSKKKLEKLPIVGEWFEKLNF